MKCEDENPASGLVRYPHFTDREIEVKKAMPHVQLHPSREQCLQTICTIISLISTEGPPECFHQKLKIDSPFSSNLERANVSK
jgi:hypothetical protein